MFAEHLFELVVVGSTHLTLCLKMRRAISARGTRADAWEWFAFATFALIFCYFFQKAMMPLAVDKARLLFMLQGLEKVNTGCTIFITWYAYIRSSCSIAALIGAKTRPLVAIFIVTTLCFIGVNELGEAINDYCPLLESVPAYLYFLASTIFALETQGNDNGEAFIANYEDAP